MHSVLNEIGDRIKGGAHFASGDSLDDVIAGYPVQLRAVESRQSFDTHVAYALWFYAGRPFRLFQVVWPDKDGGFPGEPGCREELKEREPLLP